VREYVRVCARVRARTHIPIHSRATNGSYSINTV
jgi:hypothetical protein